MMYKCVKNLAPKYLSDLVTTHYPRCLRSTTFDLLSTTRSRTEQVYKALFKLQGPRIWNSLPYNLKIQAYVTSFQAKLKTFLLAKLYN